MYSRCVHIVFLLAAHPYTIHRYGEMAIVYVYVVLLHVSDRWELWNHFPFRGGGGGVDKCTLRLSFAQQVITFSWAADEYVVSLAYVCTLKPVQLGHKDIRRGRGCMNYTIIAFSVVWTFLKIFWANAFISPFQYTNNSH
jgi:hypothetical protein